MMSLYHLEMTVNGKATVVDIDPGLRLLDVLRDVLHLTGTKEGCSEGECGACTVIMNGELVDSCLILAPQAAHSEIITIEGIAQNGELDPIQQAFIDAGAVQCGYCTPGMVLAAKALLDKNPNPTHTEIVRGVSGNVCRCTGYAKIVHAVELAVEAKGAAGAKEGASRG